MSFSSSYNCSDDRFDFAAIGTQGDLVMVNNGGNSMSSTSVLMNMPADASAGTSTSINWTK